MLEITPLFQVKQHIFLILTQPSWDGYLLLYSPQSSIRGTITYSYIDFVLNFALTYTFAFNPFLPFTLQYLSHLSTVFGLKN
jgi:hypothetical protein